MFNLKKILLCTAFIACSFCANEAMQYIDEKSNNDHCITANEFSIYPIYSNTNESKLYFKVKKNNSIMMFGYLNPKGNGILCHFIDDNGVHKIIAVRGQDILKVNIDGIEANNNQYREAIDIAGIVLPNSDDLRCIYNTNLHRISGNKLLNTIIRSKLHTITNEYDKTNSPEAKKKAIIMQKVLRFEETAQSIASRIKELQNNKNKETKNDK